MNEFSKAFMLFLFFKAFLLEISLNIILNFMKISVTLDYLFSIHSESMVFRYAVSQHVVLGKICARMQPDTNRTCVFPSWCPLCVFVHEFNINQRNIMICLIKTFLHSNALCSLLFTKISQQ